PCAPIRTTLNRWKTDRLPLALANRALTCVLLASEIPPQQWNPAPLHFPSRTLRHWRPRPLRLRVCRLPRRCRTEIVAGGTARSPPAPGLPPPTLFFPP